MVKGLGENIADLRSFWSVYRQRLAERIGRKNGKEDKDHGTDEILASASPMRRLELLRQVGIEPVVEPSHVQE